MELRFISRKNFFTTTGIGAVGYFILRSLPFKLFEKKVSQSVVVKIVPEAISRKKAGEKNV